MHKRSGGSAPGTQGNAGTACVTILRVDLTSHPPALPTSRICIEAARWAAVAESRPFAQ
jgi:hypothetical protein